jgi:hypothetical protein
MLKDLDIRIDKALTFLSNSKECIATSNEFGDNKENLFSKNNIVMLLVDRKLAVRLEDNEFIENITLPTCRISKKGAEIISKGGWLKFIEREKIKTELSDRKERYDFNLSKWKHNTFWWFFGFAIIGFGLSFYNFIIALTPSKEIEKQAQHIENMESELTKLHISISVQKSLDSLRETKVLTTKTAKEE